MIIYVTMENSMFHLPFSSVRDQFVIYSQFCIYSKEQFTQEMCKLNFQCLQQDTNIQQAALLTARGAGTGKLHNMESSCYWQTSWNLEKEFSIFLMFKQMRWMMDHHKYVTVTYRWDFSNNSTTLLLNIYDFLYIFFPTIIISFQCHDFYFNLLRACFLILFQMD